MDFPADQFGTYFQLLILITHVFANGGLLWTFVCVFFPFLDTNGGIPFDHTYYQLGLGIRFYVFPYKAGTGIGYF